MVFGVLGAVSQSISLAGPILGGVQRGAAYVKPGMIVNSLVILPPASVTFFFAASSSSLEAPDLRVIYP